MKMLQSLSGKLNRLNDVRQIGDVIADGAALADRLPQLPRFVVEGDDVVPIAFLGEFTSETQRAARDPRLQGRRGHHRPRRADRRVAADRRRRELRVRAHPARARTPIDESLVVVPLRYGSRVIGVIVHLEARARPVRRGRRPPARGARRPRGRRARERAPLRAARREAESATALLEFGRELSSAEGLDAVVAAIVELSARDPRLAARLGLVPGAADGEIRAARDPRLLRSSTASAWRGCASTTRPPRRSSRSRSRSSSRTRSYEPTIRAAPSRRQAFAVAPLDARRRPARLHRRRAAARTASSRERELRLLGGIAHQAKLAIANAGNFESLEQTFLETVEALANALEANDEYTSSHARWITDLSLTVGRGARPRRARR